MSPDPLLARWGLGTRLRERGRDEKYPCDKTHEANDRGVPPTRLTMLMTGAYPRQDSL